MKDFLEIFRDKSISEYRLIFIVPSKIVIYLYIRCVLQSKLIKIAHRLIYQIYYDLRQRNRHRGSIRHHRHYLD